MNEKCAENVAHLSVVSTSYVPFIWRTTIKFTHCSTASLIGRFLIIKALISSEYCHLVGLRCITCRMINFFFSLGMYLAENAVDDEPFLRPQHAPYTEHGNAVTTTIRVWFNHTKDVTHLLTLRVMTVTIIVIIIIIIITGIYIIIIVVVVVLIMFYSDPFRWNLMLKKSCRHVTKFTHSYTNFIAGLW